MKDDINTFFEIISHHRENIPLASAIIAQDKENLTYEDLYFQAQYVSKALNSYGIEKTDRVATVLPNGPTMASTFLTVASSCTCAPLRPTYSVKDFKFYLEDINARALIIEDGSETVARQVAESLDIQVIELAPSINTAGKFQLKQVQEKTVEPIFSHRNDTALILHTSGTTARPKIVPLTQENLCTSARNIMNTLELKQEDKCLNIMPLFHIHGLIGAVLSSITAGASIICTSGFNVNIFFDLLNELKPTWYTAVPTMHYSILSKARRDGIGKTSLRFIRSSSQALPPTTMEGLESIFQAPVIESYGMTEASHQMASNPLPPFTRKPGSVGKAAGPEISIIDEDGNHIRGTGEIVIRGPNVTLGYENNPEANERSFKDGWFRTGDVGYFDSEDYLYVTDRIKEIINRGGEKISPREIDETLLNHPSISEALTFAVPHKRLGETVGTAIVLEKDAKIEKWDIQRYVAENLEDYKTPEIIVFLDEIPKGATGKVQRIGLAEKLGIMEITNEAKQDKHIKQPNTSMERLIHDIWSEVLKIPEIGVDQNYFQLGGDSILAAAIITQLMKKLGYKEISRVIFLHAPTIEKMAKLLQSEEFTQNREASFIRLRTGNGKPVFFLYPADDGIDVVRDFINVLRVSNPLYLLRTDNVGDVGELISRYLQEMTAVFPSTQMIITGIGIGCILGYELARELAAIGKNPILIMIYPYQPSNKYKETMSISKRLRLLFNSKLKNQYEARKKILEYSKNYLVKDYEGKVHAHTQNETEWTTNIEKSFPLEDSSRSIMLDRRLAEKVEKSIQNYSGE